MNLAPTAGGSTYLRILAFLKPHAGVLAVAIVATAAVAVLDASDYILLNPFI